MTISLSLTGIFKQTSWSMSAFILLTWSNKSSPPCILHVKNLRWIKRVLDKLIVSWMLQRVFHVAMGSLQHLMCINWLSAKLRPMMDIAILTRLWYSFNTLGSTLQGGGSSDLSIISQRSMDAITFRFWVSKDSSSLTFKWWHCMIGYTLKIFKQYIFYPKYLTLSNHSNKIFYTSRKFLKY